MTIDIDSFLQTVSRCIKDQQVPVVDLIAIQTSDPFKILVATILSARTKDETTARAAERLFRVAPNVAELDRLGIDKISELIHPVGFFRNKARFLKDLPRALQAFGGEVPSEIDELVTLPGVGRKTANLVRSLAYGKPAICVDTHVHRIMNIWRYVQSETPLQTEMALRQTLPAKHWQSVNGLLVAFGQLLCKPFRPHCDICPLLGRCPQYQVIPRKPPISIRNKSMDTPSLRCISWNVNGLRAVAKKGFIDIIGEFKADLIALQETKAQPDQLDDELKNIPGYFSYWHSAERKGYSGVAIYARHQPLGVQYGLGIPEFDIEGRVLTLEYNDFYFLSIYFPNSAEELKRLDYKLRFNAALQAFVEQLATRKSVILCGDFNVAHKPIDLTNPDKNTKNAGYTPQERAWMDGFVAAGFIDTFRLFNQDGEQYTWWSYRFSARSKNIGWRIDYFCVDAASRDNVVDAGILSTVMGSDHCPVSLDFLPRPRPAAS